MPRKGPAPKRPVVPDSKFGSQLVTQLVSTIMLDGKRSTAEKIVYDAFEMMRQRTGADPVAILSHELRTPLASVLGYAVTLEEQDLKLSADERREAIERSYALAAALCVSAAACDDDAFFGRIEIREKQLVVGIEHERAGRDMDDQILAAGAEHLPVLRPGHGIEVLPEVGRDRVVGDVGHHARLLAVLDLPERVAAELAVVALLVDRVAAAAVDHHAVLRVGDDLGELRRSRRTVRRARRPVRRGVRGSGGEKQPRRHEAAKGTKAVDWVRVSSNRSSDRSTTLAVTLRGAHGWLRPCTMNTTTRPHKRGS